MLYYIILCYCFISLCFIVLLLYYFILYIKKNIFYYMCYYVILYVFVCVCKYKYMIFICDYLPLGSHLAPGLAPPRGQAPAGCDARLSQLRRRPAVDPVGP